ncbi:hypothetical protein GGR57DRAFT_450809 [Xylariaceae sp. FL1272]|nr:hypothetical protein GGR57DRAFT_450809 [Xylariaceae sp. FL1272]
MKLRNGNTLDQYAEQVQRLLNDRGILLAGDLDTSDEQYHQGRRPASHLAWHSELKLEFFNLLWTRRLRNIDYLRTYGRLPLVHWGRSMRSIGWPQHDDFHKYLISCR